MKSISRAERRTEAHAIFCFASLRVGKDKFCQDFLVSDALCRFPTWLVAQLQSEEQGIQQELSDSSSSIQQQRRLESMKRTKTRKKELLTGWDEGADTRNDR
jgi:hypothetical protein